MGAASRVEASGRRPRALAAALFAPASAAGPAASRAVISRGSSGAAVARSTTPSSTTTPTRRAPSCERVQSLIVPPSPRQGVAEPVEQLLVHVARRVHVLRRRVKGGVRREAQDDATLALRALLDDRAYRGRHLPARHHPR